MIAPGVRDTMAGIWMSQRRHREPSIDHARKRAKNNETQHKCYGLTASDISID
jgi:hypothetical protein